MIKDKKIFAGSRLDMDSDKRNLPATSYSYAMNCLTGAAEGANLGCVQNRKGNTLVNITLPNGNNKCIGTCEDIVRNAIIYFVYNNQNMHSILRYNIQNNTIDKICYAEPYLNFQRDYLINDAFVIGDLLYFNDGYFEKFTWDPAAGEFQDIGFNGPRKINMVKAYNYTNGVIVTALNKYSAITEQVLDRIKWPPQKLPALSYETDSTQKYNYLFGHVFQFAYSYTYDDGETSTLSPISYLPLPLNQEYPNGNYNTQFPYINNVIEIYVETSVEIVTRINLFVREGNTGDWYKFDTIEKYDESGTLLITNSTTYLYGLINGKGFYNNYINQVVDQADAARPFDYVGQTIDAQVLVKNNRIVDGGIVENYDNTEIDVSLVQSYEDVLFSSGSTTIAMVNNGFTPVPLVGYVLNLQFDFPAAPSLFALYVISFEVHYLDGLVPKVDYYSYPFVLNQGEDTPWATYFVANIIKPAIESSNPKIYSVTMGSATRMFVDLVTYGSYTGVNAIGNLTVTPQLALTYGFKEGFTHYFGIKYFDRAGRSGAVNISETSNTYIKFITETAYAGISSDIKKAAQLSWLINHVPPEWATHYTWCYAKNTPTFFQYYYNTATINAQGNIDIDIQSPVQLLAQNRPKSILTTYTWTKGDRIRFIASGQNGVYQWWYNPYFVDVEIVAQVAATGHIIIEDVGFVTKHIQVPAGYDYNIYEIYTPQKINSLTNFYEIGQRHEIGNPHTATRYHKGNIQSQTSTLPAIGSFLMGDCYIRARYGVNTPIVPVECQNVSDYYSSTAMSIGRISAVIPNIKRQKYIFLRYGGIYLEDTLINNLSKFQWQNKTEIENGFGNINSLREVGNVLKVLQDRKNTSIGIGVNQIVSSSGSAINVVTTTEVLGYINPSEEGYGCVNPESVLVNDRYLYFYDFNYGHFIRSAPNGMIAISQNGEQYQSGVETYFRNKKNQILAAKNYKVFTGYNDKYGEVMITFVLQYSRVVYEGERPTEETFYDTETIVFNEKENRWKTTLNYYAMDSNGTLYPLDCWGRLGDTLLSFVNGECYLENSNILRGYIFGRQTDMIISVEANIDYEKRKTFHALEISTDNNKYDSTQPQKSWSAIITVPPTADNPTGSYTNIDASAFVNREGTLYSEIPRDINSPMSGTILNKKVNGNVMRGQAATIQLKNTNTDEVNLYSVIIHMLPSEKSK